MDGLTIVNIVNGIVGYTHGVNPNVVLYFILSCIFTILLILSNISAIKKNRFLLMFVWWF